MPGSAVVLRFRNEVDSAKEARARERERAEAIERAMARARTMLEANDFDQAESAAEEALQLAPDHAEARVLQDRARETRARREKEALDSRAAAAVQEADRLFQNGRPADAIAALENFTPAHPRVTTSLTALRQVLERIERERREAQERADKIAAAIASAAKTAPHDQAIAILEDALKLDPAHSEVKSLLSKRRAARDQELRLAKEQSEKIARALAHARTASSHEAAIEALQGVLALETAHPEATRLLAERQSALMQEREAARRATERAQAVAAALGKARATPSHEAAIAILRQALTIDSDLSAVRQQLAEREAALEREQTAARLARERAEKIGAALASAKKTAAHAAAVTILEEALKLDPAHAEVKALLAERRAARDEEARQAHERREKIVAAVAKANKTASHEAAIEVLEGALAIEPADGEVRRLLSERQTALSHERELARERAEKVSGALASAKKTAAHAAAVTILEDALKLDPAHAEVKALLAERRAARDEEARQAHERREKIVAAVAKANKTASHEAAIEVLEGALAIEPADA